MRRPMKQKQLEPRGISEHSVLQPKHATKVRKSRDTQPCEALKVNTTVEDAPQNLRPQALSEVSTPVSVHVKVKSFFVRRKFSS